jgi:hypothetical protein
MTSENPNRILAIDPTTKGFGYIIFELPFRLVQWGRAHISGDKEVGALFRLDKLMYNFNLSALVLEDIQAPGSLRRPRVRGLIESLMRRAKERGLAVHTVARTTVLKRFSSGEEPATKYSVAETLARYFPELASKLPPPRKMWQSEDERLSIFDALALAVTYATA